MARVYRGGMKTSIEKAEQRELAMRNLVLVSLMFGLCACAADEGAPIEALAGAQGTERAKAEAAKEASVSTVRHIGNAGLLIVQGETKILFDPLYRNGYNNYHLVPADVKAAVIAGVAPFDEIDAVLISHAHGDHFDADDLLAFHAGNPNALIIAPSQAIEAIEATGNVGEALRARFVPMGLDYGADPLKVQFEGLNVEAVRIPHAGGAGRRAIENLVYRVTLEGAATVMHMGDADPALEHFTPYEVHWQARETGTAFPPYWFFLSAEGVQIADEVLNAREAIGVHVPVNVPAELTASGRNFFGEPGEIRNLNVVE